MKLKKILFLFVSILLFSINVYADSSITVTKKVNGVDNVNVTFFYELIPKSTNPDNSNFNPNTFNIVFDENSTITDRNAIGSFTLDFSTINYSKPGKYEYVISEISSTDGSIYPKDNNYYTIELNVLNVLDSNNNPTGQFTVDVLQNAYLNESDGKSEILFETTPFTYTTLSKTVTGDIADMNEYFKFKITIDDDFAYSILGQDSSVVYNGEVIETSSVYNPSIDNYVYLKHGQSITIGLDNYEYQMPTNTSVIVEEQDAQNYKTYINGSSEDSKNYTLNTLNTPSSNNISYVNNSESTVLTGIFVSAIPYVILIALTILGIYVLKKKSKKTDIN